MSTKSEDNTTMIVAGLATFAVALVGIGLFRRSRPAPVTTPCKIVEESVYRGFKSRIEECPVGTTKAFMGILPIQTAGTLEITADEGDLLKTIDDARWHVQKLIDAKLGARLQAVFVGTSR